jgi:hypothetical protein
MHLSVSPSRRAASVGAALALVVVALGVQGPAAGTNTPSAVAVGDMIRVSLPPAAAVTTRLTFRAASCEGCRITAMRYLYSSPGRVVSARDFGSATVREGMAVIQVPTAKTRGMAFQVETPDLRGSGGAVPVAVLRYRGEPVRSTISKAEATSAKRGSWCWAGTTSRRKTIVLRTYRFTDPRLPEVYADSISVWSKTSLPVMRSSWSSLFRGGLGHQDAPWCR